ncbi:MAG: uncharacterized membrane protein YbhN (UPF0104 family) [Lentisphaeria bacterium]|jgi:uncharacterized membrane protein YbhN (UPF0104 family)
MILVIAVDAQHGWKETLSYWGEVPPTILASALILFALSHVIRAYRIYELVFSNQKVRFLGVAKISAWHQFANNLLPMRLGEAVFPLLLKHHFGRSWSHGFAKLIWLRLLDMAVIGIVIGVVILLVSPPLVCFGLIALGIACLIFALYFGKHLLKLPLISKVSAPFIEASPKSFGLGLRLTFWTALAWFCKLTALTLIIRAVLPVPFAMALAGQVGAELSGILPVSGFAGAGSFEAAFWAGASLFGTPNDELFALAVNTHIFVLASTTLVALFLSPVRVNVHARP